MASMWHFISRNWQIVNPPEIPKATSTLKLGLLGAANIAVTALIKPARSHPEVVIQAVAARDRRRAVAYAQNHDIPQVFDSYEALLEDPAIDAVYIPLPAAYHYEWALRALSQGKHVLLEKPAVVNAIEAERLFLSPLLRQPNAPVLLEAFHFRFQPTWKSFLDLTEHTMVERVVAEANLPSYMIPKDGIKFDYDLGGGNILDLGTYVFYALRNIMGSEPEECIRCTVKTPGPPYELCDEAADATFRFSGGRIGETTMNLRASVSTVPTFKVTVFQKEEEMHDQELVKDQMKTRSRSLMISNFLISAVWHRIDIVDEYMVRNPTNKIVSKRWTERRSMKVYGGEDVELYGQYEPYWNSYRHQLEQFVNRIRGRKGSGLWVSNEDSIAQARMIDMAYEKSGLPLRRTSKFELAGSNA